MNTARYFTPVLAFVALCCATAQAAEDMYKVQYLRRACNEWIFATDNNRLRDQSGHFLSGVCVGSIVAALQRYSEEASGGARFR